MAYICFWDSFGVVCSPFIPGILGQDSRHPSVRFWLCQRSNHGIPVLGEQTFTVPSQGNGALASSIVLRLELPISSTCVIVRRRAPIGSPQSVRRSWSSAPRAGRLPATPPGWRAAHHRRPPAAGPRRPKTKFKILKKNATFRVAPWNHQSKLVVHGEPGRAPPGVH